MKGIYCDAPNGKVYLDAKNSVLIIAGKKKLCLSATQTRFFTALANGFTSKKEIIKFVWVNSPGINAENNYHQLVFQVRRELKRTGLPPELLQTIPRHGLKINPDALGRSRPGFSHFVKKLFKKSIQ
ncbi:winged helix-turn-helix domain-containing protein [Pantoea endophytica]